MAYQYQYKLLNAQTPKPEPGRPPVTEIVDKLKETLSFAKSTIKDLKDEVDRLSNGANSIAVVVEVRIKGEINHDEFTAGVEVITPLGDGVLAKKHPTTVKDGVVVLRVILDATGAMHDFPIPDPTIRIRNRMPGTVVILRDGAIAEVQLPDFRVKRGDYVTVNRAGAIVSIYQGEMPGAIVYVNRVIDEDFVEIASDQGSRMVFAGSISAEKGDRVVVDASTSAIYRNLGKDETPFLTEVPGIQWSEIGGLEEAKAELREAIELPFERPELFVKYGKRPIKGVLLSGPPGCGKTLLGRAAATSIARVHGKENSSEGFIYVKGPEILSRYVGSAEATIRGIFANARNHKMKTGFPAVIFIDEADAILSRRGTGISSDMEKTIVPTFLTEMDGAEESGAIVFLATNRSDVLDPAIVRDRRIDRKIRVSRPDKPSTIDIFKLALANVPLSNGDTVDELAQAAADDFFDAKWSMYEIETHEESLTVTLGDLVSGGMIVNVVDHATSYAMRRDIDDMGGPSGLVREDLSRAIRAIYDQNQDLSHQDAIVELTQNFADQVKGVKRLRQS